MTPLQGLRLLPVLVEQRARLRLELSELERQLGDVATALSVGGSDGQAIVTFACAAVDPDELRAEVEAVPKHGAMEQIATDVLRYTPGSGFTGQDAFSYVIRDPHPGVATVTAPAERFVHDGAVDQAAATAVEIVHVEVQAAPEIAAAVDEPAAQDPEIVRAEPDGGAPSEVAAPAPAAAEPADDAGLLSCKRYGELCGVSEPVIYNAITKGWLHGDAVVAGPPKRVRVELADRQILERASAGLLRAGVAKRCERAVVVERLAEDGAMSLGEAVRFLRRDGCFVRESADPDRPHEVDGVGMSGCALIEKATKLRDRRARLAAADRSAA